MIDGNDLAYPLMQIFDDERVAHGGFSKRELFAGMAMQGLLSNPALLQTLKNINPAGRHQSMAETALLAADALILELNKEK